MKCEEFDSHQIRGANFDFERTSLVCKPQRRYPCTVIRVEDRNLYLSALDRASIDLDIGPFATFIAERVRWSFGQAGQSKSKG